MYYTYAKLLKLTEISVSTLDVTTTCVELHNFRGLYVLKCGGGDLEMGMSTLNLSLTLI